MATYEQVCSGVGGFSYANRMKLVLEVTETNVEIANNRSKVYYKAYLKRISNGGRFSAKHQRYVSINGSVKIDITNTLDMGSNQDSLFITDGTTDWIYHNDDGTKSIPVYAKIQGSSYGVSAEINTWVTLQTIPRYTSVAISERGKTSSSISINWYTTNPRDWTQYSLNGNTWTDAGDIVDSFNTSGYFTIGNLSPSTEYSIRVRCRRTDSKLWSESNTIYITTYARTIPNIWVTGRTSSSISVDSNCNVVTSDVKYRIKRNGGSYGGYQTGKTFSGLSSNTSYTIEVYAVGKDSGESGTATTSIATFIKPIAYIYFDFANSSTIRVTSDCNTAVEATNYRIKRFDGSFGNWQQSNTFSGLSPDTTYIVQVEKYTIYGEYTWADITISTKIAPVSSISLVSRTPNSLKFTSSCNTEVTKTRYRFSRCVEIPWGPWGTSNAIYNLNYNECYDAQVEHTTIYGEISTARIRVNTLDIARILSVTDPWSIEDPISVAIDNSGNCQMQLYFSYNGVEIISRANISLSQGKYILTLTKDEQNLIYKLSGNDSNPKFKIILKSYLGSKIGEDSKTIFVNIPTKVWVDPTNNKNWKRAIIWVDRTNNKNWQRSIIIPWVDPNNDKRWIKV